MRRGGVITQRRRRRERGKVIRRRAMIAGAVLLICSLAMSPELRERIAAAAKRGTDAVQTLASHEEARIEVVLPEMTVYALQLGVYDSGARAKAQQEALMEQGVPCIVWQRDKMRIVCAVAGHKEALDAAAAGGHDAYVITDAMPNVRMRIGCAAGESEAVKTFVELPDRVLTALLRADGQTVDALAAQTRSLAQDALAAHPEHLLYAQLAQSLINWCDLMERYAQSPMRQSYAAVTMYTICREWRMALTGGYSASAASTACAQRTPSTAADVMPPA